MYTLKEIIKINSDINIQFIKIINYINKKKEYNKIINIFFKNPNITNYINIVNYMNDNIYKLIYFTNIFETINLYKLNFVIKNFITNNNGIPIDICFFEIYPNGISNNFYKGNILIYENLHNYLNNIKLTNININNLIQNTLDNKIKTWKIIHLDNGTSISIKYTNSTTGISVNSNQSLRCNAESCA